MFPEWYFGRVGRVRKIGRSGDQVQEDWVGRDWVERLDQLCRERIGGVQGDWVGEIGSEDRVGRLVGRSWSVGRIGLEKLVIVGRCDQRSVAFWYG
jgi:hypothetical protein